MAGIDAKHADIRHMEQSEGMRDGRVSWVEKSSFRERLMESLPHEAGLHNKSDSQNLFPIKEPQEFLFPKPEFRKNLLSSMIFFSQNTKSNFTEPYFLFLLK